MIAGTLGLTEGVTVLVGCLVAADPEVEEAEVELLSGPGDGLDSGAVEADVLTGVSDEPLLPSAGVGPLDDNAGDDVGLRGVGGGGLEGLGGLSGLALGDGEPVLLVSLLFPGEDLCSTPSTAGELSRLRLMTESPLV